MCRIVVVPHPTSQETIIEDGGRGGLYTENGADRHGVRGLQSKTRAFIGWITVGSMTNNTRFPYEKLPPHQYWRNAIASVDREDRDAQSAARFQIDRSTAIVSAGSCFAQRIAERLRADGFNYLVTEPGPAWMTADQRSRYDYGRYSARYGNVYSTLQMLQLMQRATGEFVPAAREWARQDGGVVDPFRPTVQPRGFSSIAELEADRRQHLGRTLEAFQTADVVILTLGLTEVWCDARDGACLPMCPGRGIGTYDDSIYRFRNLTVSENVDYLSAFVCRFRSINPAGRILLTVSPVPLIATYERDHVLGATSYSKSVLLVAAREVQRAYDNVDYFASYELLWSPCMPKSSFAEDGRTITDAGVEYVMRTFCRHYARETVADAVGSRSPRHAASDVVNIDQLFRTCDDEATLQALAVDALSEDSAAK